MMAEMVRYGCSGPADKAGGSLLLGTHSWATTGNLADVRDVLLAEQLVNSYMLLLLVVGCRTGHGGATVVHQASAPGPI